jgi:O-acetyl-ADP-ribose deacetylase (regulator of RNase III)
MAERAVRDGLSEAANLERATFVLYSGETYAAFELALSGLTGA